eukprot:scaffold1252_cov45-Phaeocystis_antarctica.AAC.1
MSAAPVVWWIGQLRQEPLLPSKFSTFRTTVNAVVPCLPLSQTWRGRATSEGGEAVRQPLAGPAAALAPGTSRMCDLCTPDTLLEAPSSRDYVALGRCLGSRLVAHASRLTTHDSRLMAHGSCLTPHDSRRMAHGS